MRYRRFGKTEKSLSLFSLGTMRFASAAEAQAVIAAALDSGINHIETAPAYGPSEAYIGQALSALVGSNTAGSNAAGSHRTMPLLTTKLTPTLSAEQVVPAIQDSLARLGVEAITCLAIHGLNTAAQLAWVVEHMLAPLAEAKAEGLIGHIGFSTHGPLAVIESAIATRFQSGPFTGEQAFDFVNLHYNYFFQRNAPAIAQAHQQDMGIFIISPADKAGLLYTPPARLKDLCAPFDPLLLNYRWLLSDPRITTLSIGPAIPAELDWPLQVADADGPLTTAEQQIVMALDQAQVDALGRDRCAQCHECLPCPEAINIPEVLRLRNLAVAYNMDAFGQYRYGMFENAGHWFPGRKGDKCTDCGDCLPRCPEQLNIPALLKDTHQRLRGKKRRRLWDD
ncbi:MAG: aldo/keto reductase [Cyanobacteria bacterium J06598_3]